jgi:hypothetical protein
MNKCKVGQKVWFVYECGNTLSVQSGKVTRAGVVKNKATDWPYVTIDKKITIGEKGIYHKAEDAITELERRLHKRRSNNL